MLGCCSEHIVFSIKLINLGKDILVLTMTFTKLISKDRYIILGHFDKVPFILIVNLIQLVIIYYFFLNIFLIIILLLIILDLNSYPQLLIIWYRILLEIYCVEIFGQVVERLHVDRWQFCVVLVLLKYMLVWLSVVYFELSARSELRQLALFGVLLVYS